MVTITSANKKTHWIAEKISTNAWTGGSDAPDAVMMRRIKKEYGEWVDGPEAGQSYTCQQRGPPPHLNSGGPGATISGCSEQSYLNWADEAKRVVSREPNDYIQTK